jgi:hypothetical protein
MSAILSSFAYQFRHQSESRAKLSFVFASTLGRLWPTATSTAQALTNCPCNFTGMEALPGQF